MLVLAEVGAGVVIGDGVLVGVDWGRVWVGGGRVVGSGRGGGGSAGGKGEGSEESLCGGN